jgi:hypothetical protein
VYRLGLFINDRLAIQYQFTVLNRCVTIMESCDKSGVVHDDEQLSLLAVLKRKYPLCIVVYNDDKVIMVVPSGWMNYYAEGHPSDPLNKIKLWCWYPVGAGNPKDYIVLPEITEDVLRQYSGVGFQEFPVRRMPNEKECGHGKCIIILPTTLAVQFGRLQLTLVICIKKQLCSQKYHQKSLFQTPVSHCERHLESSEKVPGRPPRPGPPWNLLVTLQVSLTVSYGSLKEGFLMTFLRTELLLLYR